MAASRWLAAVNELHVCGTFQLDKSYVGEETFIPWVEAISFPIKPSTFHIINMDGPNSIANNNGYVPPARLHFHP